ncbi:hypothetical protein PIROE2DRAFT_5168, partial [Piromyces sp. E2]
MNTIFQEDNYKKNDKTYDNKNKTKPVISDIETIKLSLKMLSINQNKSNKNDNNNKYEIPSFSSQYNYFDSSDTEEDKSIQNNRNIIITKKDSFNMKKNGYKEFINNNNNMYNGNTSYPLTESSNYNSNDYYMLNMQQQYGSTNKVNNYDYFKNSNELSSLDNLPLQHQNINVSNQYYKFNIRNDGNGIGLNSFHSNDLMNYSNMNNNNNGKNNNNNNVNNNNNNNVNNNNNNNNSNNNNNNLYGSDFFTPSLNDYKNQKANYKKKNDQNQTNSKNYFNVNRNNDKSLMFIDNSSSRLGLDSLNKSNDFSEKNEYGLTYNKNNMNSNMFFNNNYLSSKFSFNTSLNLILNNSINLFNNDTSDTSFNYTLSPSNSLSFFSNNVFDKDNSLISNSLNFPSSNTTTPAIQFPTRPGYGKNGKIISIKANFYPILSLPKFDIHHYEVTIEPETTSIKLQKIYQKWEEENQNTNLKNFNLIFDGKKNIYTS